MGLLRPFQRRFLKGALAPGIDTAALSLPRGNGKSWLAAHILSRGMTPGDPLHVPGGEYLLCASSIEQARLGVFLPIRAALEPVGALWGLLVCPLLVADEPGTWDVNNGQLMFDAIQTAQGKPGSSLRAVYIGTLAPFGLPGHWWHNLIADGSHGSTYVQSLQGDRKTWDQWPTIRKANPLVSISAKFRRKLLEERDDARADSRLRARFQSYRLNVPSGDESTTLLTVDDWERTAARPVPARAGRPVVGLDLGSGRAWSAAVAMWPNGRCEAVAVAPGIPDIAKQEARDRVPAGSYRVLVESGALRLATGLRVPQPGQLWELVQERWGRSRLVVCDRFRLNDLRDAVGSRVPLMPRVTRWSDAAADIRALRKSAKDGPLAVPKESRPLMVASLAKARVQNDDQGSFRLVKGDPANNTSRDDVGRCADTGGGRGVETSEAIRDRSTAVCGWGGVSIHHKRHGIGSRRWRRVRWRILRRDNWRCRGCGKYGNEVDHVTPLHKGGEPWNPANLQCLCRGCHIAKTRAEYSGPHDPAREAWRALVDELRFT